MRAACAQEAAAARAAAAAGGGAAAPGAAAAAVEPNGAAAPGVARRAAPAAPATPAAGPQASLCEAGSGWLRSNGRGGGSACMHAWARAATSPALCRRARVCACCCSARVPHKRNAAQGVDGGGAAAADGGLPPAEGLDTRALRKATKEALVDALNAERVARGQKPIRARVRTPSLASARPGLTSLNLLSCCDPCMQSPGDWFGSGPLDEHRMEGACAAGLPGVPPPGLVAAARVERRPDEQGPRHRAPGVQRPAGPACARRRLSGRPERGRWRAAGAAGLPADHPRPDTSLHHRATGCTTVMWTPDF